MTTTEELQTLFGDKFEIEEEAEGGQPNGIGTIEPNGYREWFTEERETHHRQTFTIIGPWIEGPTEIGLRAQRREAERRERLLAEGEERDRLTYERLRRKFEPTEAEAVEVKG